MIGAGEALQLVPADGLQAETARQRQQLAAMPIITEEEEEEEVRVGRVLAAVLEGLLHTADLLREQRSITRQQGEGA